MKKMLMLTVLFSCALSVFAAGKKDVILVDNPDKPHYGEGGGSGVANLPIDAPEITPDMVGDTTVPIGEVSQRPFETLTGKVKVSDGKPFVSAGLFSKVTLSFPKSSDEHALTTQDILDRRGKTVTLEGWYSEDRKSFVVFSLVE